jgi:hypothetical protein
LAGNKHRPKGEAKVEREQIDPVYRYVDNKIKSVRREIKELKVAQDSVAKQISTSLLDLQRIVVSLKVNSDVDTLSSVIDTQLDNDSLKTELIAEASALKSRLMTSNEPYHLGADFLDKWGKILRGLGADMIKY